MTTLIVISICVFVLLIILLMLFGILLIQRIRLTKKKRKIDHYITTREIDWYAYLIEDTIDVTVLAPANDLEREAIDNIFFRYRRNFYSKKIHYKIFRYAEQYLESYYKDGLRDRRWSIRMNTLQRIVLFNLHFLVDDVLQLAAKKRLKMKEEWLLIYKIIAKMKPESFVSYVIRPAVPFGEFDYYRLLSDLDEKQLSQLVDLFDDLSKKLQYAVVDCIGYKYFLKFSSLLKDCLTSDDTELRIRTLKSFSKLGYFPDTLGTSNFIESSVWEERLMVAKVYANAPTQIAQTTLAILLEDPVYDVREQAARSIQMIRMREAGLRSTLQQSDDGYAIEMATEITQKV